MNDQEITLNLTVEDMDTAHQTNKDSLASPRFYHFNSRRVTAKQFHDASLILFKKPDGTTHIIKDRFGRMTKK